MSDEHERIFDDVARELRSYAPIDSRLDEQVMGAVRLIPRHGRFGLFSRLTRPRAITVTPLSWGLIAASALIFAAGAGAMVSAAVRAHAAALVVASDCAQSVQFTLVAPNANKVAVVGDFNKWNPALPSFQAQHRGGGVWTATASVPCGTHEYSFVVDDSTYAADPTAPRIIDNDFGIPKSAMIVSADR